MRRPIRTKVKLLADFRSLFGAREQEISLALGAKLRDLLEANAKK